MGRHVNRDVIKYERLTEGRVLRKEAENGMRTIEEAKFSVCRSVRFGVEALTQGLTCGYP